MSGGSPTWGRRRSASSPRCFTGGASRSSSRRRDRRWPPGYTPFLRARGSLAVADDAAAAGMDRTPMRPAELGPGCAQACARVGEGRRVRSGLGVRVEVNSARRRWSLLAGRVPRRVGRVRVHPSAGKPEPAAEALREPVQGPVAFLGREVALVPLDAAFGGKVDDDGDRQPPPEPRRGLRSSRPPVLAPAVERRGTFDPAAVCASWSVRSRCGFRSIMIA